MESLYMVPFQRPVISWQKANTGQQITASMRIIGFIGVGLRVMFPYNEIVYYLLDKNVFFFNNGLKTTYAWLIDRFKIFLVLLRGIAKQSAAIAV